MKTTYNQIKKALDTLHSPEVIALIENNLPLNTDVCVEDLIDTISEQMPKLKIRVIMRTIKFQLGCGGLCRTALQRGWSISYYNRMGFAYYKRTN